MVRVPNANWVSYEVARKYISKFKFKSALDYKIYLRTHKLPKNHPRVPQLIYGEKGEWKGYTEFLGHGNLTSNQIHDMLLSYDECVKFIRKKGITVKKNWLKFAVSKDRPIKVPRHPDKAYKKTGDWKSWGDFFGEHNRRNRYRNFRPYEESKKFAQSLNLKNTEDWFKACRDGKVPYDIPSSAIRIYRDEWEGWGVFLGTGNKNNRTARETFMSFEEAKKWARESGIKSASQWKKSKLPLNIPKTPEFIYGVPL